jgi:hypothetical protein
LHPRADQRDKLAAEKELKIAVLQRAQRHGQVALTRFCFLSLRFWGV